MRKLPFFIFLLLMATAAVSSFDSVRRTERMIAQDVDRALAKTMEQRPDFRLDADTLAVYRSNISIAEVRDTACLTMLIAQDDAKPKAVIRAESGCSLATTFILSDQRASGWLVALAVIWLLGSSFVRLGEKVEALETSRLRIFEKIEKIDRADNSETFGTLTFIPSTATFLAADGTPVRFTPMQQQLMEMFFRAPGHTLTKQEICAALWPKKPDATDTLYTLIKRLKPILEANCTLRIESDRSRAYRLVV